jgi:DNA-binding NarL/FixJ family response regulator
MVWVGHATVSASSTKQVLVIVNGGEGGSQLCRTVSGFEGLRCCGVASSFNEGLDQFRSTHVDVVLIEHGVPGSDGMEPAEIFHSLNPDVAVVVLASAPSLSVLRTAARSRVAAFAALDTPAEELAHLLRCVSPNQFVVAGETSLEVAETAATGRAVARQLPDRPALTRREQEVLGLLGRGLDTATIAEQLDLSVHTARGHVKRILTKLRAHSQLEAVITASEMGILPELRRTDQAAS